MKRAHAAGRDGAGHRGLRGGALALGISLASLACGGAEQPAVEAPVLVSAGAVVPKSRGGLDRVGLPAPAWGELEWLGGEPLALEDLRGRVVLIRFWTDTCPFCRATAPALVEIDADYRDRGVTVVGMYHPKPRGSTRSSAEVGEVVAELGWRFPIALDLDWSVLDAFWLAQRARDYTSVSFVLDRRGVVRYVHPGPEFHPDGPPGHEDCRRDHQEIRDALDALLAEPLEG